MRAGSILERFRASQQNIEFFYLRSTKKYHRHLRWFYCNSKIALFARRAEFFPVLNLQRAWLEYAALQGELRTNVYQHAHQFLASELKEQPR